MQKFLIFIAFTACVICLLNGMTGCGDSGSKKAETYLIKIGEHRLTAHDYNNALEIAKTAYPHNEIQGSDVSKSIMLRLLNQLIEEMVITVKASELGIAISDEELNAAIVLIKEDYPEDEFKQAFLENAISFESWKKRLKVRLLIKKFLKTELQNKISITPEDISKYYKTSHNKKIAESHLHKDLKDVDESIIKDIRRKKAEDLYNGWMENLQKEYTIDINKKMWNKMIGS
ncbi:MAG: SurA N-terminal domain-containing protein [Deltaproteobacteria bacterium]|nr:SurA N-terminal domain-containing protein [Deltaproteobacteria bacterium]MBW2218331.1 SurA N-terminal domain-containing protein [Deltaproteobacteria bacterium]